jgi:hypothetical protein
MIPRFGIFSLIIMILSNNNHFIQNKFFQTPFSRNGLILWGMPLFSLQAKGFVRYSVIKKSSVMRRFPMTEIAFSNHYHDISEKTGFQFEFYCEACGDAWRTEYKRYLAGTASGFLGSVSSLMGGLLGGAEHVADRMSDAGYRTAHDQAFAEAVEQAKVHFKRCRRCGNYFCNQCFNPNLKLCTACAPSVEEEAHVAARQTEIEMAAEKAQEAVKKGKTPTDGNVVCPGCGARVKASKFCAECGQPIQGKQRCASCQAEIEPGTKFCPECGQRQ